MNEAIQEQPKRICADPNGKVGPKKGGKPGQTEPATVENQAAAAKEVFTKFKQDFERPKQQQTPSQKDK